MSTTEMKRKQVSEIISYEYSQTNLRGSAVTYITNQLKKRHSVNFKIRARNCSILLWNRAHSYSILLNGCPMLVCSDWLLVSAIWRLNKDHNPLLLETQLRAKEKWVGEKHGT